MTSEPLTDDLLPDEMFPAEETEATTKELENLRKEEDDAKRNYLEEFNRPKPWTPEAVTIENLRSYLPRAPFGGEGSAKGLEDRLHNVTDSPDIDDYSRSDDLVQRLKGGHYVRFRNEEEREAVVRRLPTNTTFKPLSQPSRQLLEQEIVEGKYQSFTETTQHGTLDQMIHLIRQNGSYTKEDETSMLRKLTQLLPAAPSKVPAPTSPPNTKTKRRAKR